MSDASATIWTAIASVGGVVLLSFTIFRYVAGIRDILAEKIMAEAKTADTKIDSVSRETRLIIEKLQENFAKTQHDLANNMTGVLRDVRVDAKALEEKFNAMMREIVKQDDLRIMRSELVSALKEQDRTRVDALDRLELRLTTSMREIKGG